MPVFTDRPRTDGDPKRPTESSWAFYDRCAWPAAGRVRDAIEWWVARFPERARPDLISRLRSSGAEQHSGAFLALLTFQFLEALVMKPSAEPELPSGGTPDFLARIGGVNTFVECTTGHESEEDQAANHLLAVLDETVDAMDTSPFFLHMDVVEPPHESVSLAPLRTDIREFLARLDPDDIRRRSTSELPEYVWTGGKSRIRFAPFLLEPGASAAHIGAIGTRSAGGYKAEHLRLQSRIEKKAEKYGKKRHPIAQPLSIVVALMTEFAAEDDLIDAMLGRMTYTGHPGEKELAGRRDMTGVIGNARNPHNQNISAVLFISHLNPWTAFGEQHPWQLIHHPFATRPLPRGEFPFATEWIPMDGKFERVAATKRLSDLLGVPDPWPGPPGMSDSGAGGVIRHPTGSAFVSRAEGRTDGGER